MTNSANAALGFAILGIGARHVAQMAGSGRMWARADGGEIEQALREWSMRSGTRNKYGRDTPGLRRSSWFRINLMQQRGQNRDAAQRGSQGHGTTE